MNVSYDGFSHLGMLAAQCAQELSPRVEELGLRVVDALREGRTLYFCGNGGSAADAQHLAAEYVVRFANERRPLPAVALTVDTSILTAGGNDYGFDHVFSRQLQALGREGDILFLHSTSGESQNLIEAATVARTLGMTTVGLLAKGGGRLRDLVDAALVVPTDSTARAQELHLAMGHHICQIVDDAFSENDA